MAGRGTARAISATKSPWFRNIVKKADKRLSGKLWQVTGEAFQKFIGKLMPRAAKNIPVGQGLSKHTIDFALDGYLVEAKSGVSSSFNTGQLKAAAKYAREKGRTLVYFFLHKPPGSVQSQIIDEGGNVIYLYEKSD